MGECAGGKALDDLRLEWPVLLLFAAADLELAQELWWQMGPMTPTYACVFLACPTETVSGPPLRTFFRRECLRSSALRLYEFSSLLACYGEDPFKQRWHDPASSCEK